MPRPAPEYTIASLEAEPVADFTSPTRDDAVTLGEVGIAVIREWNRNLAVEVRVGAELAFGVQLGTTSEENASAISGKVATVTALGVSSLWRAGATRPTRPTARTSGTTPASGEAVSRSS